MTVLHRVTVRQSIYSDFPPLQLIVCLGPLFVCVPPRRQINPSSIQPPDRQMYRPQQTHGPPLMHRQNTWLSYVQTNEIDQFYIPYTPPPQRRYRPDNIDGHICIRIFRTRYVQLTRTLTGHQHTLHSPPVCCPRHIHLSATLTCKTRALIYTDTQYVNGGDKKRKK